MKILVVEDNQNIVEFLKKALEEESYSVDVATDGKEAFYLATTYTYEMILLDIMIPFMSGIELCKEIRKYEINTPIIMLTAKDDSSDIVKGLDAGADDYMIKPFIFEELLARIRSQSRRTTNNISSVLSFKDLELDLIKKTVSRDSKNIDLTAKEFSILQCLMQNKKQIISESTIIESVWDMNHLNASNLVKVYIYRLRNKIDKPFNEDYIHNIKGIGYTLK